MRQHLYSLFNQESQQNPNYFCSCAADLEAENPDLQLKINFLVSALQAATQKLLLDEDFAVFLTVDVDASCMMTARGGMTATSEIQLAADLWAAMQQWAGTADFPAAGLEQLAGRRTADEQRLAEAADGAALFTRVYLLLFLFHVVCDEYNSQ